MQNVTITLKLHKVCKHSIRYDATSPEDAKKLSSIYIGWAALKLLSPARNPEKVDVTIQPHQGN